MKYVKNKYIKWIRDTALKMKEIVEIFYKKLDKDIIFNAISYEREVISIPAADTISLIYKYGIHAHPNDKVRYPYKKSLFYTFREKNGVMTKLYELNTTIILNPNKISEIDDKLYNDAIKESTKRFVAFQGFALCVCVCRVISRERALGYSPPPPSAPARRQAEKPQIQKVRLWR